MAQNPASPTSARAITARQRETQAVQLRQSGATYDQIADALGYSSRTSAYRALQREMKRYSEAHPEANESIRELMIQRLDRMLLSVWPNAQAGDLDAINIVLQMDKRRSDLLGLDAPKSIEARMKVDILSYNAAIDDFVAAYRDAHEVNDQSIAFMKQIDSIVEERLLKTT